MKGRNGHPGAHHEPANHERRFPPALGLRVPGDAFRRFALQHRLPDDPQCRGRRGPRPGGVPQGLQVLREVRGGDELQGLAVQDHEEHLHQQLPQAAAGSPQSDFAEIEDAFENQLSEEVTRQIKSPEDELLENVLDEGVQRALDSLPDDYRIAVILADLENFSYKEIAEILEVPVGTVMSRLYRGRKMLEQAMLGYAREHGYLRTGDEPVKMRSRKSSPDGAGSEG